MSRILLVYGTGEGQTAKVVRRIASIFSKEGKEIDLIKGDELSPGFSLVDYDGILLAGSIHMGKHQKYIVKFIKNNLADLERIPSAFVSVSISAAAIVPKLRNLANVYYDNFVKDTGWNPKKFLLVGGALQYTKYNLLNKLMLRFITRNSVGPTDIRRDYEYTNWDEVETFARELLQVFGRINTKS
jgi:menaquinone-dependent protoporphyrinogen oxidase